MKFRTRLTFYFGLFSFVLCLLFALLLFESLTTVEDEIASSMLEQEANYLLSRYQKSPQMMVLPDLEQLKGFISGQPNIPKWLEHLDAGYHQTDDFHVLVRDLDTDRRIYLVYDEASGMLEQHEADLGIILGVLILIVSAVGTGLGFYQATTLARPINYLAAQVEQVSAKKPEIKPLNTRDEIGALSRAYADLVGRLGQFIEREKAFTRYSSHELKTPLSVISNNIELLRTQEISCDLRNRATSRLNDAATQMQQQIDIFLLLAREGRLEASSEMLDWDCLLDKIRMQFHQVSISTQIIARPEIYVKGAVVETILINILSNVVKHGVDEQGVIKASLSLDNHSVKVINAIPHGRGKDALINGFGLEINEKLCEAVGWQFYSSEEDNEFSVVVQFNFKSDANKQPFTL